MRTLFAQVPPVGPTALPTPDIEWVALAPLLVLFGGALLMLTVAALTSVRPVRGTYALITVLVSVIAAAASALQWSRVIDPERGPYAALADAIVVDGFSIFFTVLICLAIALGALLVDSRKDGVPIFVLMLLSGAGGVVMAMASDLIVIFLGLETLSIALYVLAGSDLRRAESREAAIKYFVLGAFSSAFLLYGIALIYGATGSTTFVDISTFLSANLLESNALLLGGFALLLVGLGFKVAAVPFHAWTPDVYQGAPTPVTAFLASASKAAGFAALLRVFGSEGSVFGSYRLDWQPIMWVLAVATLVVGAVLAVVQRDVKRMLAYSSISHAGFVLVGVQVANARGTAGALFYLLAYTFMVIGSFAVVAAVEGREANADIDRFAGLARRRPGLAFAFTVFLLAQAGVPLTSGFLAKFYVIGAAVEEGGYALGIIAMVAAVIAAFVYLRIIVAMYMSDAEEGPEEAADAHADEAAAVPARVTVTIGATCAIGMSLAVTVVFGLVPGIALDWARDAVPVLIAGGG